MNLYGLIGYPLGHSFSKKYFTQKFENEDLGDCFFKLFSIGQITLFPQLLAQNPALRGLAVTIPYKEAVMPYLQYFSNEAKAIGAVNCIEFLPEGLKGHNTDVIGFEKSFLALLQPHHISALILGTGGASKAVQFVLKKNNIPFILVSRTGNGIDSISYTNLSQAIMETHPIIINASPVGMYPRVHEKPALPYQFITARHYLYDLIYGEQETGFLTEGKARGAITKNRLEMLQLQAEENWKIWNREGKQ